MLKTRLKVVEIFYSLQGEGANSGKPFIFIRLAGCNMSCWFCDTEWNRGDEYTVEELLLEIKKYPCNNILWTGGEPTLQLTDDILRCFDGYYHAIESNGTNPIPDLISYSTVSPKSDLKELKVKKVSEVRLAVQKGDRIPALEELPLADSYFLSPIFVGEPKERYTIDPENLSYCIGYIKDNPQWRLSLQMHKLLNIP